MWFVFRNLLSQFKIEKYHDQSQLYIYISNFFCSCSNVVVKPSFSFVILLSSLSGQCGPVCAQGCLNGTCVSPGVCLCHFGFVGDNCSLQCSCNKHSNCAGVTKPDVCLQCHNNTIVSIQMKFTSAEYKSHSFILTHSFFAFSPDTRGSSVRSVSHCSWARPRGVGLVICVGSFATGTVIFVCLETNIRKPWKTPSSFLSTSAR